MIDLNIAEKFLRIISRNFGRLAMMQTFYALIFSKKRKEGLIRLPESYLLNEEEKTPPNLICRHCVNYKTIRRLFYFDAVKVLKKIIEEGCGK